MISFKSFLAEGNKKYYPYRLNRRKRGQKHRSIAQSNSSYVSQKKLRQQVSMAHRKKLTLRYKKKTTTHR